MRRSTSARPRASRWLSLIGDKLPTGDLDVFRRRLESGGVVGRRGRRVPRRVRHT